MIRLVIFDLDDTLYREADYVEAAYHHAAEYLAEKYQLSLEELFEDMMFYLDRDGRGKIFNVICEKYQLSEPIENLVEVYRSTTPELTLYPDAEALLQYLDEAGIMTGVLTDGMARVQHTKITALRLESRMDVIMVTDDLGVDENGEDYGKPSTVPFQKCLDKLGVTAQEAMYIGDNPKKDFIGCRSLGMKTVRIHRKSGNFMHLTPEEGYEADAEVEDLMQIKYMLHEMAEEEIRGRDERTAHKN